MCITCMHMCKGWFTIRRLHLVLCLFVCETRSFIICDFLVIEHKNVMQRNVRIESESILVSRYVGTSVDAKVTQRNAWCSVIL